MPYKYPDNIPRPAKNWTEAEQKKCIKAANAVLRDKGTEQDAIFACIRAAGKTKHPGGKKSVSDKSEDLDKLLQTIHTAFRRQFPTDDAQPITRAGYWITRTFDDYLIAEEMAGAKLYRVSYSKNVDGDVSIVPRSEWEEVHIEYMAGPAKSIDGLNDETFKRYPEFKQDNLLCVKSLGQHRFGGYLILWGDPERKDLTGEYFTSETAEMLNIFEAVGGVPAMYHHAADDAVKSDVLGKVDVMTFDDVGLWVEAQARKAAKYKEAIADLIERKSLYWSSGCLPKSRKVAADGRIERWTICDATLTPTPAEHRMVDRPIQAIKSIYEQVGLAFPDDEGPEATGASPAGDADDARQRAIQIARARLELIKIQAGVTEE